MNILIDIGHPAHVHLFKNFAKEMQKKGHKILFTCREKEFEIDLLRANHFQYVSFGKKYNNTFSKIIGMFIFDFKMLITAIKFKPHLFLSHGSIYASHAAWFLKRHHISLEDTGNWEQIRLYKPFTQVILTPETLPNSYGEKQIKYKSHHEIAYLHPSYFKPNKNIYNYLNISPKEKYVIIRFVAWNASHDIGQNGLDSKMKYNILNLLLKNKIKVFISSEKKLPNDLKKYQLKTPPEMIHDVLYFADFVISEGSTFAMEAGLLGTPAIYINSLITHNCQDLEKYGLVFPFYTSDGIMEKIKQLINFKDKKSFFDKKKKILFNDKIDLTAFLVWFIDKYPYSFSIAKKDKNFQKKFQTKSL